jgi:hypothetical protein
MISASTVPKQLLHLVTEMGHERLETSNLSVLVLVPLNYCKRRHFLVYAKLLVPPSDMTVFIAGKCTGMGIPFWSFRVTAMKRGGQT